ncbi:MAG: helical backbone metal receptor [Candidatus Eisenbacteria bacterium]
MSLSLPRLKTPRLVSLVPSWTETLLECGANVVGRSRFCIHPSASVASIPKVGGTKDVDWSKVERLAPDLIILDKEENTREIAERSSIPVLATHVRSLGDCGDALALLRTAVTRDAATAEAFARMEARWRRVEASPPAPLARWNDLPGLVRWIREPGSSPSDDWSIVYLIWQEPWMCVTDATFIGSVLEKLGLGAMLRNGLVALGATAPVSLYPTVDPAPLDPERTLLLCSSEPFPFGRKPDRVSGLDLPAALVDGELFSWFGVRSLRALEAALSLHPER